MEATFPDLTSTEFYMTAVHPFVRALVSAGKLDPAAGTPC
jgi:hypothetical protein